MPDVVVLRPGYAFNASDGTFHAAGTISLVLADMRILVDTGGPAERSLLIEALASHGLAPADVDCVVCTHGHVDHTGNNNLFPTAVFLAGRDRVTGEVFTTIDLSVGPLILAPGVLILATPGHTPDDLSVLVTTEDGVVAIVGDVFENGDPRDEQWIAFSADPDQQRASRALVLSLAEVVVPGHGDQFAAAAFRAARE